MNAIRLYTAGGPESHEKTFCGPECRIGWILFVYPCEGRQEPKTRRKYFDKCCISGTAFRIFAGMAATGPAPDPRFEFRVTAGGPAVEEREMVGSPHEMLTIYHKELTFSCDGKPGGTASHVAPGHALAVKRKTGLSTGNPPRTKGLFPTNLRDDMSVRPSLSVAK